MDIEEYRCRGKEMVDYIVEYLKNIRNRRVYPDVKPGYLSKLIPSSAPVEAESWEVIMRDVEQHIMPGITHWQSPHMHAYFPALNSFPSLLGDMLADAINCLGFTWASSPAVTELEIMAMNWLGKMIGLPDEFLYNPSNSDTDENRSLGGGAIQTTSSEATLVCLLAGRTKAIHELEESGSEYRENGNFSNRLVAYCSDQAHSSVEKAGLIGLVKLHYIESDDYFSMRVDKLAEAIAADKNDNLVPFFVCSTLGTTAACAFDNLELIGPICTREKLWLHVDAAYAGSSFVCPEFRIWLKGIHYADSFAFNPSKWLLVHFDCTAMWVKNCEVLHRTFNVDPLYLKHENSGHAIDYMHWQIPLSKRFRALKLWFVIRSYGLRGLQHHIRYGVYLAKKFEEFVTSDSRFEIPAPRHLGLVVFALKSGNHWTERLLKRLNSRGKVHCVPAALKGKYVVRFAITSQYTTEEDVQCDWNEIKQVASIIEDEKDSFVISEVLEGNRIEKEGEIFGSTLLLSNTPMSPKVVDASFAGVFENDEKTASPWSNLMQRLRVGEFAPSSPTRQRSSLKYCKQFSLDSRNGAVDRMFIANAAAGSGDGSSLPKLRFQMSEDCIGNDERVRNF